MCLCSCCFRCIFEGFNQPTRDLNSVTLGGSQSPIQAVVAGDHRGTGQELELQTGGATSALPKYFMLNQAFSKRVTQVRAMRKAEEGELPLTPASDQECG